MLTYADAISDAWMCSFFFLSFRTSRATVAKKIMSSLDVLIGGGVHGGGAGGGGAGGGGRHADVC